jgi:CheY-like chemotaxis protein/DnaJ-domain-containing protein 1
LASILCVDDDRGLCQILARALGAEGFDVRTAHDGEEALLRAAEEAPDLLILDVMLPRRDGFEVLERLRAQPGPLAALPALVLSGCSRTPQAAERTSRLGVREWLTKPVPLERLVEVVRKTLDLAPPAPAGGAREARVLSGALDELAFPGLLHHLHGLRAEGVLELRSGRKRKALELRGGHPVGVRSNLVHECLGNLLVSSGRIDREALEESVNRMRRGEGLQGEILVAMELLSEQELAAALRSQAEEKLFEIFTWASGEYRFAQGARLARANVLALERSPGSVILAGVRERSPLDAVDRWLRAHAERAVAPGESPFYRFQEIDLDDAGTRLLDELRRTPLVGELLARDERTRRTLFALLATEMVEIRDARSVPAPAPARPIVERVAAPRPREAALPDEEGLRLELTALAESLRGRDHFAVLGVSRQASPEEVRAAFLEAARRAHPDRFRASSDTVQRLAEEVFGLLSHAHETLVDPARRQLYLVELGKDTRKAAQAEEGRRALQAELRFQEGERALRKRDYEEALRCFAEAVTLHPEEGEYHAYRGWALFLARPGNPTAEREAVAHLRRARKLAPDREKPYLFLGRLHREAGRSEHAQKCFTRALQINPSSVEAVRELRLIQMRASKAKGRIARWLRR